MPATLTFTLRPTSAALIAVTILAALSLHSEPDRAQASHLCGNTGSPFGPFDFQTYEAADYKNAYARTFELAGFNQLFPDVPSFAMPALETGDRAVGSGQPGAPYIPPVLLKSIAWIESGWAQASYDPVVPYGTVGPALVSHDCGYGIMQVTTGMQNVSGVPNLDQAMIGGHYGFNIARGARILADKWNLAPEYRPIVGNRDPHIIENWYYALWSYNGFSSKNHPLNPNFNPQRGPYLCNDSQERSAFPYQELVLGCVANPPWRGGTQLWPPQAVALPDLSNPAFAEPLKLDNWAPCSQNAQCAPMDMPTPFANQDPTTPGVTREQVIGAPALSVSTTAVTLGAIPGGQSFPANLDVSNSGSGVLSWRATSSAPWLKLSRYQGISLGADLGTAHKTIEVRGDATGLPSGLHQGIITIESLYSSAVPTRISVAFLVDLHFETLEGDQHSISQFDGNVGRTPAAIQFNSTLQLFHFDDTNGYLRRDWSDTAGWHFEVLDGAGGAAGRINARVGEGPAVTIYNNVLHIFYFDSTNGHLRHAWSNSDATSWIFETLDGGGGDGGRYNANLGQTPAVVVFGSTLQVFYYDATDNNLRHAWLTETTWNFENLDGDPGSIGGLNSDLGYDPIAIVNNDVLQLFYYDAGSHSNLRHAWSDDRGWHFENLDGDPGSIGRLDADLGKNPAVAIHNGGLQLLYYDATSGNLRHAFTATDGWRFENLEGDSNSISRYDSNIGGMPTLISAGGVLQSFYYEYSGGNLRHGWADATGWHFENLDGRGGPPGRVDGDVGYDPNVSDYSGGLQLYYYDATNGNLRHSWSP